MMLRAALPVHTNSTLNVGGVIASVPPVVGVQRKAASAVAAPFCTLSGSGT